MIASEHRRVLHRVAVLVAALVVLAGACSRTEHTSPPPRPGPPSRPIPPSRPAPPATTNVWTPRPGTTWQWQITGTVDTSVSPATMFDVDLSDAMPSARTAQVPGFGAVTWPAGVNAGIIPRLHAMGKTVICYMDSGAFESYRPDAKLFPASVIGSGTGWDGERWLDLRPAARSRFAPIVWSRMDVARSIGCDGVEPDQNNPIGNDPGFPITVADQTSWYLEVARQAHARHLSVGMKNGIESINRSTVSAFDWALNEECFQYDECEALLPFVGAGKAVFQVEYQGDPATICPVARRDGFSSMKKRLELDSWRQPCF
ncbi:MAG TPA: endo alpha-1,4 polygalactosaminidase [Acidimicrobiia bacterium]|jgi:hypothetical protein